VVLAQLGRNCRGDPRGRPKTGQAQGPAPTIDTALKSNRPIIHRVVDDRTSPVISILAIKKIQEVLNG
jgi:hypothetical protein